MAVEIKELIVKATVTGGSPAGNQAPSTDGMNRQEIVSQCVAEVLRILQREKER